MANNVFTMHLDLSGDEFVAWEEGEVARRLLLIVEKLRHGRRHDIILNNNNEQIGAYAISGGYDEK
jgi:hypothetical protein